MNHTTHLSKAIPYISALIIQSRFFLIMCDKRLLGERCEIGTVSTWPCDPDGEGATTETIEGSNKVRMKILGDVAKYIERGAQVPICA